MTDFIPSALRERLCGTALSLAGKEGHLGLSYTVDQISIQKQRGIDLIYTIHDLAEKARQDNLLLAAALLAATAERLVLCSFDSREEAA